MQVYRVEHPGTRWGPYCNPFDWDSPEAENYFSVRWGLMGHHDNPNTHPRPQVSMSHEMDLDERCGFDNLDSLLAWFDQVLDALEHLGFQVVEYDVPRDYVKGPDEHGQVVFPIDRAELVC